MRESFFASMFGLTSLLAASLAMCRDENWDAQHYRNNSSMQYETAKSLLENIEFPDQANVVDVGSGDGRVTKELLYPKIKGGFILAVDPNKDMNIKAAELFNASGLNIITQQAFAHTFSHNEKFDAATSFFSLHWADNPAQRAESLKNIGMHVKPGGRFVAIFLGKSEQSSLFDIMGRFISEEKWRPYFNANKSILPLQSEYEEIVIALDEAGFYQLAIKLEPVIKEFESNAAYIEWIKGWSPIKKYIRIYKKPDAIFEDEFRELKHEEFLFDAIQELRELTGQAMDPCSKVIHLDNFFTVLAKKKT